MSGEPNDRVAVLLSTFNGEKFLAEQLESIAQQTHPNVDLIVRDDGSSDATLEILRRYGPRALHRGANLGPAQSFLELLSLAGPDYGYYAFCDQDDVWHPDKLARAVEQLTLSVARPTVYMCRLNYVSATLETLSQSRRPAKVGLGNALVENWITGCGAVINARARQLVASKSPRRIVMHDAWVYLVVSAFGQAIFDDRPLVAYRQHGANVVGVSDGWYSEAVSRLRRLAFGKGFRFSDQARELLALYGDELTERDRELVRDVVRGKTSLVSRLGLAFNSSLWRQRKLDDAILRVMFLLNRY